MTAGTLIFRADASVAMGTGHVMRCLALAQAWQDTGGRTAFAMAQTTPALCERLRSENVEVIEIAAQPAGEEDAQRFLKVARDREAAWAVVDGLHFGNAYERILKSERLKLMIQDDGGFERSCAADMILNSNSQAVQSMYPRAEPHTRLLLGSQYVLLRRQFSSWLDWKRAFPTDARTLLVSMGGSDPDQLTGLVVEALGMVKAKAVQPIVVAGGSNPHFIDLEKKVADYCPGARLERTVFDMPELMSQADFAIIAAGGTLWELLYMSCPVLSFSRTPVQRDILSGLHAQGIVEHLGDPCECEPAKLAALINELGASLPRRERLGTAGRRLVDGYGAKRVCEVLAQSN